MDTKTEAPIFTDPFPAEEREFVTLWERWDTMPDSAADYQAGGYPANLQF
jgi:hypothetical protein